MKKIFTLLSIPCLVLFSLTVHAKIWRVNNNLGITADFTTFNAAANSASVLAGDTLYMEPSNTQYSTGSFTLTKRLVVVGPGFFLDPASASTPGNAGLQVTTFDSEIAFIRFGAGSDAITIRKCFFNNGVNISGVVAATVTNFVCENNIFYNGAYITLTTLSGSGNIVRNNSIVGGNAFTLSNTYVANNIFAVGSQCTFANCTIKNNLFQIAQTLPGTAVGNQLSVNMANVYVGGSTGSLDSRTALKAGSPALAAGLTIGAVVTPDCGAFGATDPYKLSGIPNIPSIYAMTVPISIPSGSATMNVTFSTRNNN